MYIEHLTYDIDCPRDIVSNELINGLREGRRKTELERDGERERESVCVCVRERERERREK